MESAVKRFLKVFITVFVLIDQGDGTFSKASYEGQSQKEVEMMLQNTGKIYAVVDRSGYSAVAEPPLNPKTDAATRQKDLADCTNKSKAVDERLDACIKAGF